MSGPKALRAPWKLVENALALRGWEPVVASADSHVESVLAKQLNTIGLPPKFEALPDHNALKRAIGGFVSSHIDSLKYSIHANIINSNLKTESDGSKSLSFDSLDPTFLLQLVADAFNVRIDYFELTTPPTTTDFSVNPLHAHVISPHKQPQTGDALRHRIALACLDQNNWCPVSPAAVTCFPASFGLRSYTSSPVGIIVLRSDCDFVPHEVELAFSGGETVCCQLIPVPIPSSIANMASGQKFYAFIPHWRRMGSSATTRIVDATASRHSIPVHPVSFDANQSSSFGFVVSPLSDAVADAHQRGFFDIVETLVSSFGTVAPDAPAMPSLSFSGIGSAPRSSVAVKGLRNPVNTRCLQSAIRDVIAYFNPKQNAPTSTALIATPWSISADFKFATNRLFDLIITIILLGTDKMALVCFQSAEHEQMFLDFVEQIRENTALDFSTPLSKNLISRASEAVKRGQPEPICRTCTSDTLTCHLSDPSFGLILKLDESSIPKSTVPIVQFTHITSRHDFSKSDLVIIHQTSLNDAVHDGIIRNLGAVSLGDSASAEAVFIESELRKLVFSKPRFLHVALDGMETDDVTFSPLLSEPPALADINAVVFGPSASTPKEWNALMPGRGSYPLLIAAAPGMWNILDFLACFSQIPLCLVEKMYAACIGGKFRFGVSATTETISRLSSAFSDPVSVVRTKFLQVSFPKIQSADKMDVDAPSVKDEEFQAPASKRRKSSPPEPSIPFDEDLSRRTKKQPAYREYNEVYFVPEEPENVPFESAPFLPSAPPKPKHNATQNSVSSSVSHSAHSPASAAASKPKREKPARAPPASPSASSPSSTSSSALPIALESTGAIIERQELLIIECMSQTKRNGFLRSIKLFLLRYGFAPFGSDLEAYTSFFKFNTIRLFRELVIQVAVRLAQVVRDEAVAFCKTQLQMTDEDIEIAYTLTSILLFLRYLDADVSVIQTRAASLVQSSFFSPQHRKPQWWNAKMEIRACLWLRENGCPSSWSSELDKTWLHQDFVKDGGSSVPKDWKVIGKELDAAFLPLSNMIKRFYALLQFLQTNQLFSSWRLAQQAADILFSSSSRAETSISPSPAALPPAPKRQRHWLVKQDESIVEQDKEYRPGFYAEIAYNLALRYANDYTLMSHSVLKDHNIDCLKFCGKGSTSEYLACCIGMIQSQWNEILDARSNNRAFPLLGMLSTDVRLIVRMAEVRRMTVGLWKRDDVNRVDLNYSRLTRLYKSESYSSWVSANLMNTKMQAFPSKTDVLVIMTYLLKYGVPSTLELPLIEAILGAEGPNDWRRRKDTKWDEDKISGTESLIRLWMKNWLGHLKSTYAPKASSDREVLMVALEMFAKQVPAIMADVCLPTFEAAELWKETISRLGYMLDDDDVADIDFEISNLEDGKELSDQITSTNIQEAAELLQPFIETMVESKQPKSFALGSSAVKVTLDEAQMIVDVTNTRYARKRVATMKHIMHSPHMQSILWVNSTDPVVSAVAEILKGEEAIPTIMELCFILVLFEFGIPQNFQRYGKIIADVLGGDLGKSSSKMGVFSVRSTALTDLVRRIRDFDRTWEGPRSDPPKGIKQQLQSVFAGESGERLIVALRRLGSKAILDHLKDVAAALQDDGRKDVKEVKDIKEEHSADSSANSSTPGSKKRKRE